MTDFNGTPEHYERLRSALVSMYSDGRGITSGHLIRIMRGACDDLKQKSKIKSVPAFPYYTTIDKFRVGGKGGTERLNHHFSNLLWVFIREYYSEHLGEDNIEIDENAFFRNLVKFYDVHQHRNSRIIKFTKGIYKFYHFSEYFDNALVVGKFEITSQGNGSLFVKEVQSYDGRLGMIDMTETFIGCCIPKHSNNLCFFLKEVEKETPKHYIFDKRFEDNRTGRTAWMTGYMLKASDGNPCFHSPVYAVRVDDGSDVACNIIPCSEVDAAIVDMLLKERRRGFGV